MATSTLGWWRKFERLYSVAQSRFGHRDNLLKVAFLWTSLTRCLTKNNPSFDEKQPVVWWKTSHRLTKNITSFKKKQVLAYPTRPTRVRATSALPFIQQMWNSRGTPLPFARAYTGVLSFLLSQVSQPSLYFPIFQYITDIFRIYFNR